MDGRANLKAWLTIAILFAVSPCAFQSAYGQPWEGNGTEGDPYLIYDANQMYALGYNPKYWDKHFVLMDDVDIGKFTGKSFNMVGNFYRALGLAISSSEAKLYWTAEYEKIQRSNLDGTGIEDHISADIIHPRGIAIDDTNQKIYWTDIWTGKIKRANSDGTNVEDIIVVNRGYPYGLALDISGGKVYWTDLNFGTIQKANLDGTNKETIITKPNSGYPRSISVDTVAGKICWTNPGAGRIQRSNLDGTNIEDLATVGASAIALDTARGKMYWSVSSKIQRANLDGTNIEDIILEDSGRPYWITLDINNEKIYWTNAETESVRRANFDGSEIESLISSKFAGVFDGNGHKIRNFVYEDSKRDGVGLFQRTGDTAEIKNVHLEDVNVTGNYCVGALVGLNEGVVTNCSCTGVVSGCENVSGLVGMGEETSIIVDSTTNVLINVCDDWGFAAGGLVGHNFRGIVSDCSAAGSVQQGIDTYFAGGLIGFNEGSTTNCFATGDVSGYGMIGGLIGENGGWAGIENCYATGNVLGSHGAGGLIGRNFVPVLNCYAMGNVTEGEDAYYGNIGGLIGWDCDSAINCYSTGFVSGTGNVGAFVGHYDDGEAYKSCFWNSGVNPDLNDIGNVGDDPNIIGLPTAQMQDPNTFIDAGWDFNTPIWKFCSLPDYPKLAWQACPGPEAPVLDGEPNTTIGTSNTIFWGPVAEANDYLAECANDVNFAGVVYDSGRIMDTNCTFTGLEVGQQYFYRVKARDASGIESDWSNVESSLQVTLGEAVETVLDANSLQNENMMNALLNKIDAALAMIDEGLNAEALTQMTGGGSQKANTNYNGALSKLQNDILAKMDGCAEGGEPDKNDWLITCEAQDEVYPLIIETIDYVMALME